MTSPHATTVTQENPQNPAPIHVLSPDKITINDTDTNSFVSLLDTTTATHIFQHS